MSEPQKTFSIAGHVLNPFNFGLKYIVLLIAARAGRGDTVRLLLDRGEDMNVQS